MVDPFPETNSSYHLAGRNFTQKEGPCSNLNQPLVLFAGANLLLVSRWVNGGGFQHIIFQIRNMGIRFVTLGFNIWAIPEPQNLERFFYGCHSRCTNILEILCNSISESNFNSTVFQHCSSFSRFRERLGKRVVTPVASWLSWENRWLKAITSRTTPSKGSCLTGLQPSAAHP